MNYEIIYKAANSYEAHFIKGLLKKYSIESTPTIVINEKKFEGSFNFESIEKKIEKLI